MKISNVIRLLRGEVSTAMLIKRGLVVGENFSRQGGCRIDTSYCFLIEIGDSVILAPNVNILAHDASLKNVLGVSRLGRVNIGNNVFVGASSIILPNVTIGNNVIIGAGSVVNRNIPDNCVAAGNPAKVICSISDLKNKNFSLFENRPFYNRSYNALDISSDQKLQMKSDLNDGFGFFECDNFKKFEKEFYSKEGYYEKNIS